MSKIKEVSDKIKHSVGTVFKGDENIIDMILAAIFATGHPSASITTVFLS